MNEHDPGAPSRRRFLQLSAAALPAAALSSSGALGRTRLTPGSSADTGAAAAARRATLERVTTRFKHRGHHVQVDRHGYRVSVHIDGKLIPAAVEVRNDGALSAPDYLPFSDGEWGTDVQKLVRRLIDGNGEDYIIL